MINSKRKGKEFPNSWKSGPDQEDHKLYISCQRSRAQAHFRQEDWQITEQQYIDLWRIDDRYKNKGRGSDDFCLCRIDEEKPWTVDNVEIITRKLHLLRCSGRRRMAKL